jgi:hypothetical protein
MKEARVCAVLDSNPGKSNAGQKTRRGRSNESLETFYEDRRDRLDWRLSPNTLVYSLKYHSK